MSGHSVSSARVPDGTPGAAGLDRIARRLVRARLEALVWGKLTVRESGTEIVYGDSTGSAELCATLTIHDPRFFGDVAFGGSIGAAEAFIRGYWSCDDLTTVVRILVRNSHVLEQMEQGAARLVQPLRRLLHRINQNTRKGSRRNISAHYDLGNDFFALWLDDGMMYSSALFADPEATLEAASVAKLERACRWLELGPEDSIMEIGTGWGGFAVHAAKNFGCHVTTTTLSKAQFEYARERVEREGLTDRITLLMTDYRDLEGSFDKLVSIEMFEAVGHEYHGAFFRKCRELLKPDGAMFLQTITIGEQRYRQARKSVDFIQRYVFPGGALASISAIADTIARETDMRISHLADIGAHYALTLNHWRRRFFAELEQVRALGYGEEFVRLWHYYLSYCEGAFIERAIGDVQMLIEMPLSRRRPVSG